MALKADLRKDYLRRRRQMAPDQIEACSQQITDLFFALFAPRPGQTVHTFLPIEKQQEINTWPLVHRLWQQQVEVAVPVSHPVDTSMTHFLITPDTTFQESLWGIPEPVNALPVPEAEIDLALVPLLAFDLKGHRVGYGKGFYDRFLALLPKATPKIGLALEPPVEVIDDVHVHDLALDAVVTPDQVYRF
ncbi:5-formyltetrahydrofolate cyclo-ligase [Rufibacter glacialis]|uniref:5-formyltetrahydrofolate cyclo-ligase n=1 Tax=Rufibacter glacialis TaxID=1259555 RepID=A0A5M8QDL5_9BACT|nr:5-formyltetrahydrofolate cyclo-ligase [Rufibacter glacialis]KAA6433181.1 5-formyltetrahydrofolate cyclo-ligase [Rufibacter glacialis]GGK76691.1 5-formyltetrahydrofolate cyclo-ligase [Rufibacter glacialis]